MSVRRPNNDGRAVQTDPTLLRYASAITEQKKCWELLAEKFDRFQTLRSNSQQDARCANGRKFNIILSLVMLYHSYNKNDKKGTVKNGGVEAEENWIPILGLLSFQKHEHILKKP